MEGRADGGSSICERSLGRRGLSRVQGVLPGVHVPRLLAFYQESRDGDAATSDWQPVAWGLTFENGSVLTVPVDRPVAVTLWRSLSDAEEALGDAVHRDSGRGTGVTGASLC